MIWEYVRLGTDHILDKNGYDHILFVIALCSIYLFKDWKKVLVLVTAFTIGHSLTLALSSFKVVNISSSLVETLIPVTIIITCIFNVFHKEKSNFSMRFNYLLAMIFGLIHGLGFSNFFRALMFEGENIVLPLLSFNIGVEIGQIVIVLLVLALGSAIVSLGLKRKLYTIGVSLIVGLWAVYLMNI